MLDGRNFNLNFYILHDSTSYSHINRRSFLLFNLRSFVFGFSTLKSFFGFQFVRTIVFRAFDCKSIFKWAIIAVVLTIQNHNFYSQLSLHDSACTDVEFQRLNSKDQPNDVFQQWVIVQLEHNFPFCDFPLLLILFVRASFLFILSPCFFFLLHIFWQRVEYAIRILQCIVYFVDIHTIHIMYNTIHIITKEWFL